MFNAKCIFWLKTWYIKILCTMLLNLKWVLFSSLATLNIQSSSPIQAWWMILIQHIILLIIFPTCLVSIYFPLRWHYSLESLRDSTKTDFIRYITIICCRIEIVARHHTLIEFCNCNQEVILYFSKLIISIHFTS